MSIRDAEPLNSPPMAAGGVRDAQTREFGLSVPLVLKVKTLQLTLDIRLVSELAVSGPKLANVVTFHAYTESVLDRVRHGCYARIAPDWVEVDSPPWTQPVIRFDL